MNRADSMQTSRFQSCNLTSLSEAILQTKHQRFEAPLGTRCF